MQLPPWLVGSVVFGCGFGFMACYALGKSDAHDCYGRLSCEEARMIWEMQNKKAMMEWWEQLQKMKMKIVGQFEE